MVVIHPKLDIRWSYVAIYMYMTNILIVVVLLLRLISYIHYDDGGHHYTYAFCAIELLGMSNAKAALESKAAM